MVNQANGEVQLTHITFEQLADYQDGNLGPDEAAVVKAQLAADCDGCQDELHWLKATTESMREYGKFDWAAPPPGLRAATRRTFRENFKPKNQDNRVDRWLSSLFTPRPLLAMSGAVALVVIVAMGSVLLSLLAQTPELTATVTEVSGLVEIKDAGNYEWQPLDAGSELVAGDRIRSGADAMAILRFPDDSSAEMSASSQLAIMRLSSAGRGEGQITVLHQYAGLTDYQVQPQSPDASWFEVETSSASVKVIGTSFAIEVTEFQATVVTVSKGTVEVSGEDSSLFVLAGEVASILPQSVPTLGQPTFASNGPCIQQVQGVQASCGVAASGDDSSGFSTTVSTTVNSLGTVVAGADANSTSATIASQLTAPASLTPVNEGSPTSTYPPGTGTPIATNTSTSMSPTPDGATPSQGSPTPTSQYALPTSTPTPPQGTSYPPQATATPPPTSPPPTSPPPTSPPPTSPPPTSPPPTSPPPTSPPPTSPPPTSPPPTSPPPTSTPPPPTSTPWPPTATPLPPTATPVPPTSTPPPPTPTPPPYP